MVDAQAKQLDTGSIELIAVAIAVECHVFNDGADAEETSEGEKAWGVRGACHPAQETGWCSIGAGRVLIGAAIIRVCRARPIDALLLPVASRRRCRHPHRLRPWGNAKRCPLGVLYEKDPKGAG